MAAFGSLYPEESFESFTYPFIEDVIDTEPFTSYRALQSQSVVTTRAALGQLDYPGRRTGLRERPRASSAGLRTREQACCFGLMLTMRGTSGRGLSLWDTAHPAGSPSSRRQGG